MSLQLSEKLLNDNEFIITEICAFDMDPAFRFFECPQFDEHEDGEQSTILDCRDCPLYYEEYDADEDCTKSQLKDIYANVLKEINRFEKELKRQAKDEEFFDQYDSVRYMALKKLAFMLEPKVM